MKNHIFIKFWHWFKHVITCHVTVGVNTKKMTLVGDSAQHPANVPRSQQKHMSDMEMRISNRRSNFKISS